jgi:hypothetical protein
MAAACGRTDTGGSSDNAPPVTGRDSAGIRIIDVTQDQLDALPRWRLSDEPILSIGVESGESPYMFDGITASGVARLADGSIAIVDGSSALRGSAAVRIFDANGRFVRAVGRRGDGPAEFGQPPSIRPRPGGGFVATVQRGDTRVALFNIAGVMEENWNISLLPCPQPCGARGVMGDGTVPIYSTERPNFARDEPEGQIIDGLKAYYGIATRDGQRILDTIPLPPHKVVVRPAQTLASGGSISEGRLVQRPMLSPAPESSIGAGQEHFVVMAHHASELRVYRADGSRSHIIRLHLDSAQISDADKQRFLDRANATLRIPGRVVSDFWPPFANVRFGDNDDLWVSDYNRSSEEGNGAEWVTIFARDCMPVARLEVRGDPIWRGQSRAAIPRAQSGRDAYRIITNDSLGVARLLVFGTVPVAPRPL